MKEVKTTETMPQVPVSQLRKLVQKTQMLEDDTPISFELVMTALFPTVYQNIQKYSNDCYTSGYLQGLKDAKEVVHEDN